MRKSSILLIIIAFTLSLVMTTSIGVTEAVELEVWGVRDEYRIDTEEWNQKHPDIEINYEIIPWEETLDQLIMGAATDRTPDIVVLDRPWVPVLAGLGHLHPMEEALDEYWSDDEIDDFFGQSWEFGNYQGTQYAVPFAHAGTALYYRVDWFEEHGLEEPETWDDVIEAGQILSEEKGVHGLTTRGARDDGTVQRWLPVYRSFGGEFEDDVPQLDSEAGIKSLEMYQDLVFEHEIMSEDVVAFGSAEARGLFQAGDAAMSIIMTHIAHATEEAGVEYGENFEMTNVPVPEENMEAQPVSTGFQWAVHANTDHPEEAFKYVNYLTRPDASLEFNVNYMESVRESVYEMEEYEEAKPWNDLIIEQLETTVPIPGVAEWMDVSEAIQLALQEVMGNPDADPAIVAEEYQQQIDEAVGR